MKWLDIKIADPEMEDLIQQINEEHRRLKEAMREKLLLIKCETDFVQQENYQMKEWLRLKGVSLEEKQDQSEVNTDDNIVIKEELIDTLEYAYEHYEENLNDKTLEKFNCTENSSNKSYTNIVDKKSKDYIESKDDASKENSQNMTFNVNACGVNNQNINKCSSILIRTPNNTSLNLLVETNENKSKRCIESCNILKNNRTTNKKKKNVKKEMEEVEYKEDM
ncbi:hypothetical protein M0802_003870 [Mischocyttarus mexicanus]|nr:hypothetical protein M0802_003870 [Mischocyttarus mexicanus]